MLNALFAMLAQAANAASAAVAPDAPVTVNSIVVLITAAGVFLGILSTFIMQCVNAYLTLRNGLKSDINATKADVNTAKLDVAAAKAETTSIKVDQMHNSLNGELAAQRALIEKSSFAEGAKSATDPAVIEAAAVKAREAIAAAVPIAAEAIKHAAEQVAAETQKLNP